MVRVRQGGSAETSPSSLLRSLLRIKPERPRDLPRRQRPSHVLLVRQHQQRRAGQPLLGEQRAQLERAVAQASAVGRIDDPAEAVGLFEVVSPKGPQSPLPSDVPQVEAGPGALVAQGADLEAEGRGDARVVEATLGCVFFFWKRKRLTEV